MAIAKSALHRSFKGAVGDLIFRTYNGKTVVSLRPVYKNETNTEPRRKARDNFREATNFASVAMESVKQKAYYTQKARQLKLPNAYTAAITDFLRKAKVQAGVRSTFAARKDDVIQILISKTVCKVSQLTVTVLSTQGKALNTLTLTKPDGQKTFKLTFTDDWPDFVSLKIVIDEPVKREYVITREELLKIELP